MNGPLEAERFSSTGHDRNTRRASARRPLAFERLFMSVIILVPDFQGTGRRQPTDMRRQKG